MWAAWYFSGRIAQITLCPDVPIGKEEQIMSPNDNNAEEISEWMLKSIGDGKKWTVPLGPALVSISFDDLENQEKMEIFRQILSSALQLEQENITYRRLKVHISKWPLIIETNKGITAQGIFVAANPVPGANTEEQLKSLFPILVTLAFNYKIQKKESELKNIKKVLEMFPNIGSPELAELMRKVTEVA
jgi:hypothetical protein